MATTETPKKTRHLHLLCRVDGHTPSDARRILADCGCTCTYGDQTHELLQQPGEHVIYCVPCFMQEHN